LHPTADAKVLMLLPLMLPLCKQAFVHKHFIGIGKRRGGSLTHKGVGALGY